MDINNIATRVKQHDFKDKPFTYKDVTIDFNKASRFAFLKYKETEKVYICVDDLATPLNDLEILLKNDVNFFAKWHKKLKTIFNKKN